MLVATQTSNSVGVIKTVSLSLVLCSIDPPWHWVVWGLFSIKVFRSRCASDALSALQDADNWEAKQQAP